MRRVAEAQKCENSLLFSLLAGNFRGSRVRDGLRTPPASQQLSISAPRRNVLTFKGFAMYFQAIALREMVNTGHIPLDYK